MSRIDEIENFSIRKEEKELEVMVEKLTKRKELTTTERVWRY